LKFISPALARLQKGEVVDGAWIDGFISHNSNPKLSEKLPVLDFLWKMIDNGNVYLNIYFFIFIFQLLMMSVFKQFDLALQIQRLPSIAS